MYMQNRVCSSMEFGPPQELLQHNWSWTGDYQQHLQQQPIVQLGSDPASAVELVHCRGNAATVVSFLSVHTKDCTHSLSTIPGQTILKLLPLPLLHKQHKTHIAPTSNAVISSYVRTWVVVLVGMYSSRH